MVDEEESEEIQYSEKYCDSDYEYRLHVPRHVIVPQKIARLIPKNHLMTETEWRNLGIQQSPGWVHYLLNTQESHVVCFRRPITCTDSSTCDSDLDYV